MSNIKREGWGGRGGEGEVGRERWGGRGGEEERGGKEVRGGDEERAGEEEEGRLLEGHTSFYCVL